MTDAKNKNIGRILIVRYGEVALKGMNKPWFERVLEGRVRKSLDGVGGAGPLNVARSDGLIVVSGFGGVDAAVAGGPAEDPVMDECVRRARRVFGVASVSPALRMESRELADISAVAADYMAGALARGRRGSEGGAAGPGEGAHGHGRCPGEGAAARRDHGRDGTADAPLTFKIYAKRSDKTYPVTSPELAAKVGEAVLDALGAAVKVDVKNPEILLTVHLRRKEVFVYDGKYGGFGGLPLGTNGKGLVLLSGGIDSPVAAWLMAKRGMRIEAVHYHSYPYTSGRAREKVCELASILAGYCGEFRMHVVNLLPAQEAIAEHCPEELTTILTRRFMMRVAERIAAGAGAGVLITGESLGQVASQTAESIIVTDAVCAMPVMRPLIALDKIDIMDLAREIGTYEKSIEPHEDCCTVFLPKHPATKPKPAEVDAAEAAIPDVDELIRTLAASKETVMVEV
jgi:thiamine biosynthesis protein ThiI